MKRHSSSRRVTRTLLVLSITILLLATALGCSSDTKRLAEDGHAALDLTQLTDTNPDPDVFEVQLVASEGSAHYLPDADADADIWGYRDGAVPHSKAAVPGPVLDVRQGQRVIVHFRNELPEATTIHWHGIRVPNTADGTPSVQVEVSPGDTFDYEFVAGDAGTFWYHPHVHSDVQIERGLYGAVVVRGGPEIPVEADRVFVLDDVKLEATGKLSTNTVPLDVMLGRQGNVVLVNGVRGGRITSRGGARERWRFVNSANGRYFNLRILDHALKVIGWDGGLLAEPYDATTLLIAPGERYEVLVDVPDATGSELTLETVHYDRGHDVPDPGPVAIFKIAIESSVMHREALPDTWGTPIELPIPSDVRERAIKLSEQQTSDDEFPKFFINDAAFPDVPMLEARVGDVEVWRVKNDSEMDHPFHLHGMFFRVLDVDGAAPAHDGWKDTVNVPQKKTLRFAVRYGGEGTWMYHCHILEHAERGMMAELKLER